MATHYILQYQKQHNDRIFRTEIFYKKYNHLYKTNTDNFGRLLASDNSGFGYAQGVEIFWRDKKTFKNLDYWVSYSYLDTKRNYLNFPFEMTPNFAAKHTASLVVKKFVLPWKMGFNASYNFATGRPYYNLQYNSTQNKYTLADAGTTINYNNLSFSLNYLPHLGDTKRKSFLVWVVSLSNVLGQKQIYT
ncbi:MAG: TonB-dependent receptor, partial [Bacteroidetes bacterium]|nr:TonB-dependent receptor [Bacteroidota bacterium]